jgi:hypothetical protein
MLSTTKIESTKIVIDTRVQKINCFVYTKRFNGRFLPTLETVNKPKQQQQQQQQQQQHDFEG